MEDIRTLGFPQNFRDTDEESLLKTWDNIFKLPKYNEISEIVKFIFTLPTSSSDTEQAFSVVKMFKTSQRNSLEEKSLEGLILLQQKYAGKTEISITDHMVKSYFEIRQKLNQRKDGIKPQAGPEPGPVSTQRIEQTEDGAEREGPLVRTHSQLDDLQNQDQSSRIEEESKQDAVSNTEYSKTDKSQPAQEGEMEIEILKKKEIRKDSDCDSPLIKKLKKPKVVSSGKKKRSSSKTPNRSNSASKKKPVTSTKRQGK